MILNLFLALQLVTIVIVLAKSEEDSHIPVFQLFFIIEQYGAFKQKQYHTIA